jgi:hypothetical protein
LKKGPAPPAGFNTKKLKEAGKKRLSLMIRQPEPENKANQPGIAKRAARMTYHTRIRYNHDRLCKRHKKQATP